MKTIKPYNWKIVPRLVLRLKIDANKVNISEKGGRVMLRNEGPYFVPWNRSTISHHIFNITKVNPIETGIFGVKCYDLKKLIKMAIHTTL